MVNEPLDLKSGKILIVDDEYSNVFLLKQMLAIGGYSNVYSTECPLEVLGICRENTIDLILLDLNMPQLDGYGVMAQLNEAKLESMPLILVLTAQHTQEFRQRALDSGARDYVTKPCNLDELLSRVRNLLEMKMLQNYMSSQNQILENQVRTRTLDLVKTQRNLHDTQLQVIQRLGRAAEFRDNDTGYHIVRMSRVSALLGKLAGLSENECDLLLNASAMHDIGKIGIPDEILLKPAKFDSNEWTIMQTHAQIGADILAGDDSDLLIMAREIALTHHEKWDGTGYPSGLVAEEIPLVGRIAAICDVFDALISIRPYKQAWAVNDALAYIEAQSGRHFDPRLVDLFVLNLQQIVAIKHEYDVLPPATQVESEFV